MWMFEARAISPWFVQMLEVAFSRRMCCSRVERVRQKARRPSASRVSPTRRPGICLWCAVRQARKPSRGPPFCIGTPSDCASPQAMSMPAAPGGASRASDAASATTATDCAPRAAAARAAAVQSSTTPKKLGDCSATAKVVSSTAAARAAASVDPSERTGTSATSRSRFAKYVRTVSRYSGWMPAESTARRRPRVSRSAISSASTSAEAPS